MSALSDIKPTERHRVIDLVRDAGVDVSDWDNIKGGRANAAVNPKYCYEWSFVQPGQVIVLNLWHRHFSVKNGILIHEGTFRRKARREEPIQSAATWNRRAQKMDDAVRVAFLEHLPIRVIVLDGRQRDTKDPNPKPSRVTKRLLDPEHWAVTDYDFASGRCTLARGVTPVEPIFDDSDQELEGFEGEARRQFMLHRRREAKLRKWKLDEAQCLNQGRLLCEVPNCGFDFAEKYGDLGAGYAQVHHMEPLGKAPPEGRKITLNDLAVVCANCHAMIHRGGKCRSIDKIIPSLSQLTM